MNRRTALSGSKEPSLTTSIFSQISKIRPLAGSLGKSTLTAVVLLAFAAPVASQAPGNSGNTPAAAMSRALQDFHGPDGRSKSGPLSKIGLDLAILKHEHAEHVRRNGRTPFEPGNDILPVIDEFVVVDAVAFGDAVSLKGELEALGMKSAEVAGQYVSGLLPIASLDAAAALDNLNFAGPAIAMTNIGVTSTQGDLSLYSDKVRDLKALTGEGLKIGVMSDSFDYHTAVPRTDYATDVQTDDLPAGVTLLNDTIRGGDEGRAMAQIIHDIAPGATLAYHTAFGGQATFANGIRALADAGCDIIVDDVYYQTAPMFQDGIVAQAVDEVVTRGVAYFSAAGNFARRSYEAPFRDSGYTGPISGGKLHDFDPGPGVDLFQEITIPVGTKVTIVLQWDQPFTSLGGGRCQSDIDIFLQDLAGTVRAKAMTSNVGRDPIETLTFTNNGSIDVDGVSGKDTVFQIGIESYSGPLPGMMKYVYFPSGAAPTIEWDTKSGTIYGQANAAGAQAVGAAFYYNTPRFGTSTPILQSYSSAGGTPILFTKDGQRLASPQLRRKPEIVAPDGVNTTFFGTDIGDIGGTDMDGYPNFFGTSAASPHAAAVAALVLERYPHLSPGELYTAMQGSAVSMEPRPGTAEYEAGTSGSSSGFNYDTGYGLIDANNSFPSPLYVELLSFAATAEGPGLPVLLTWETVAEIDNVGFHVYRAISTSPGYWERGERLTNHLIAAEGDPTSGASYELIDTLPVADGEVRAYLLEDIDTSGVATLHGPALTTVKRQNFSAVEDWMSYQ